LLSHKPRRGGLAPTVPQHSAPSFANLLTLELQRQKAGSDLIDLNYTDELALKQDALAQFWQQAHLHGQVEPILASPKPRHYRTNSKRQVQAGRTVRLLSVDGEPGPQASLLEAEKHAAIYRCVEEKLGAAAFQSFAKHLHYIIIRGTYVEQTVILNLDEFNNEIIRKAKILGESLKTTCGVLAVFLYLDPTRSDYYLEFRRPAAAVTFKKLFGPELVFLQIDGVKYSYAPTSFSQVNESLLPIMLSRINALLAPADGMRLIDLYCGYGLFSHYLAAGYQSIIAMDINREAIRSALENKRHLHPRKDMRFIAKPVDRKSCGRELPEPDDRVEHLLLDPPYQGPDTGVIDVLAQRGAEKALHIFCSVDRMRLDLPVWEKHGYGVQRVVPLDLFPATANLEIIVLLQKS
jgi:tRNA/tmRNA/rRNA uracil-C5-methylase (TrmA/RlmC/RlmD family)